VASRRQLALLKAYKFNEVELKTIWKQMYKNNPYLFPYSSYEYNAQIDKYLNFKPQSLFQKNLFYVYFYNNIPTVIMPLTLRKNKFYLYGDLVSGAGALDFIYRFDVENNYFSKALDELFSLYPHSKLEIHKLNERSKLCKFLLNNEAVLDEKYQYEFSMERECVKVIIPSNNYDEYFKILTKNSKSNLKKLYNRLRKNHIDFSLKVWKGPLNNGEFLKDITEIYVKRELERTHKKFVFIHKIKNRYFSALTWATENMKNHYTFAIYINGKIAAFTTGFATNFDEIIFPRLAIDSNFNYLSPGKLLINEMVHWRQINNQPYNFDLSRGTERYKFEMGGIKHLNYRFIISHK
jgi:hypothetical protein